MTARDWLMDSNALDWIETALDEERKGNSGAIDGFFNLQQVASVGHQFVRVSKTNVHRPVDLAGRQCIVLIGVRADELDRTG